MQWLLSFQGTVEAGASSQEYMAALGRSGLRRRFGMRQLTPRRAGGNINPGFETAARSMRKASSHIDSANTVETHGGLNNDQAQHLVLH